MKRYFSSRAVRYADRMATERLGVPGEVLMENAGRGAAGIIAERFPEAKDILVLCGPGNNGGDGFVAARHLRLAGASPVVVATRSVGEYEREAAFAASSAEKSGIRVMRSPSLSDGEIASLAERADLVVDALLGTGSKGAPKGEAERLIKLSSRNARMVALDVPSGVDSTLERFPAWL
jgi:NAD(P)H-hydrate epimerase